MNVEDLPVAVLVLDRNRVIVSTNEAAGHLLSVAPKSLVGRDVSEALRPRTPSGEDLLMGAWHRSAYLAGTCALAEQEVVVRADGGAEIDVVVDGGYARDADGALSGATLLLRRRLRGPRRPRSGVRIVSAISHELRSPLTSVRGYTTLLLKRWDDIEDVERKVMLQQVDRDARRIGRMIGELLDIARLETGRLQLHRVEVDFAELVSRVIATVTMSYPDMRVALQLPPQLDPGWADTDKIEQVLVNLLENACKYASPDGISIALSSADGAIEVAVIDTGQGIPLDEIPSLFQQFSRRADGKPSGTGLGLWISRGLVEAHGGSLVAESIVGQGSTFRFRLPQRQRDGF